MQNVNEHVSLLKTLVQDDKKRIYLHHYAIHVHTHPYNTFTYRHCHKTFLMECINPLIGPNNVLVNTVLSLPLGITSLLCQY